MDQDEKNYYEETLRLLEESYVAADERGDVPGGSGSGSGLSKWEPKRRLIADAFDHDGTWLDAGCANGLLMETLKSWTAAKGVRVEPYGLELSDRIAQRARLRLPHWADRIWTGNVMTWEPPICFDYVTVLADFVPPARFGAMIERVLRLFLNSCGKLVVSCYYGGNPPWFDRSGREPLWPGATPVVPAAELLRWAGYSPVGETETRKEDGSLWVSVAWLDRRD
jgi:hypothetical protein